MVEGVDRWLLSFILQEPAVRRLYRHFKPLVPPYFEISDWLKYPRLSEVFPYIRAENPKKRGTSDRNIEGNKKGGSKFRGKLVPSAHMHSFLYYTLHNKRWCGDPLFHVTCHVTRSRRINDYVINYVSIFAWHEYKYNTIPLF